MSGCSIVASTFKTQTVAGMQYYMHTLCCDIQAYPYMMMMVLYLISDSKVFDAILGRGNHNAVLGNSSIFITPVSVWLICRLWAMMAV